MVIKIRKLIGGIFVIEITSWINNFMKTLRESFGERVWFVGLQGSYGRGEATEKSDIDVVVILDELNVDDIKKYNEMLDTLPNRELVCGFLSGKNELLKWEPSDLFQFCYDTTPIKGTLDVLFTLIDDNSVMRAIKISACNIYHGCIHNMLHEKSEEILIGLYKMASFAIQAIGFRQTGKYIRYQKDLLNVISSDEQAIINAFLRMKNGEKINFDEMSEFLFKWAQKWIEECT